MSDDLALPPLPEAEPDDPEDVSWALSTAAAMWARGDHLEGLKWIRRAAEAASEMQADVRALQLANAAAELSAMLTQRSAVAGGQTEQAQPLPSITIATSTPSMRRAPLSPSGSAAPPRLVAAAPRPVNKPAAPRAAATSAAPAKETNLRSRESLGAEARTDRARTDVAGRADPPKGATEDTAQHHAVDDRIGHLPPPPGERELVTHAPSSINSTEEWDASRTQTFTSDERDKIGAQSAGLGVTAARPALGALGAFEGAQEERMTSVGGGPRVLSEPPVRSLVPTQHDPAIKTSQAVRVVVWRDGSGVHIAPEGTRVSAITIDAVLVALEPSADLTAWLSKRV